MNLRGTYKKSYFREINKQLIVIGLIFLTAVVIGTYLNKMWPDYQGNIVNSINPIVEYYSSKISIKNIVLANLKSDNILYDVYFFINFICSNISNNVDIIYSKRDIYGLYYK